MPAENRGNKSRRRRMYFRETSKRDPAVSPEVEEQNYRNAFCLYCAECMERYGLQSGKIGIRRLGVCSICGNDGFISGCLGNDSALLFQAKVEYGEDENEEVAYCIDCATKYSLPQYDNKSQSFSLSPVSQPIEILPSISRKTLYCCRICGKSRTIGGKLKGNDKRLIEAHCKWTRKNMPRVPRTAYVVHTSNDGSFKVASSVPIEKPITDYAKSNGFI